MIFINCSVNLGLWGSIFAVPVCVVDEHIKLASEIQLKVLLMILRDTSNALTSDEVAKRLNIDEEIVTESIEYWIQAKVLRQDENELLPSPATGKIKKDYGNPVVSKSQKTVTMRAALPDVQTLNKRMEENPEIGCMLQEAQFILGKTLSNGDSAKLVSLYDNEGLPLEVILMLLQYAVSVDKAHIRYIEKVGILWADEGILSIDDAEKKIRSLEQSKTAFSQVQKIIGASSHSPTSKELNFCNRWVNEWKFSYENNGELSMIPWDYNLACGGFQGNNASGIVNRSIDNPISGGNVDDRPMFGWILSDEQYTKMYHNTFAEFIESWLTSGKLVTMIENTSNLIRPYFEKDPTKFCTLEQFDTGIISLSEFVTLRGQAVLQQLNGNTAPVDTGNLNISDMGSMGMNGKNFQ